MPADVPRATYRLQLTPSFGFREAAAIVDYLAELGVSHVYLSPVLQAAPDSTHGYDVVDPHRVNDELGGEGGWVAACEALRAAGLGIVLDIVPNHMSIATPQRNRWWWDVLQHGPASRYARYFDITWQGKQPVAYRRFFDIDSLIGLRVEDAVVFADTHHRVIEWVHDGAVDGLRVDHIDGLRDPQGYLDLLHGGTDGAWIVVEKILEGDERLPSSWPVAGTTGYDFLNLVNGLFVDPAAELPLSDLYAELTGEKASWDDVVVEKKLQMLRGSLAPDLDRLPHPELHEVLREVAASFSVYRTYVRPREGVANADDRAHIEAAVATATARRPDLDADDFDHVRRLLLGEYPEEYDLVERFQQFTGPVMAKGVEDTAFYTFNRFLCLNEVGGDPGCFGRSIEELHRWCAEHGDGMLATSTHDTKRSEDVRARLSLLSRVPDRWAEFARRWVSDGPVDRNTQYHLLQVLVGAWPLSVERAVAYMEKATKEAKVHTSWTDPDPAYDAAVRALVESWSGDAVFQSELTAFVEPLVEPGRVVSLAQALLKLTAPGVPDIYQGTELWDLSLVDPDNRRPVDFEERRRLLTDPDDKLLVVTTALHARVRGEYEPLTGDNVVAFGRGGKHVTVVPLNVFRETSFDLPSGEWRDLLPGLPVSLYERV